MSWILLNLLLPGYHFFCVYRVACYKLVRLLLLRMRILVADDDVKVGLHVQQALKAEGYAVDYARDGDEAMWLAENYPYDVLILDVMMPHRDGLMIARELRRKQNFTPIIFLTARGEVEDRIKGLDAGGDDYISKPFSVSELLARIRAMLRRQRPEVTNILRYEDLELDLISRQAKRGTTEISLTPREFSLLELLLMSAPKTISTAVIIERVWEQCFDSETNVVNVYMNRLRSKINFPGHSPLLHTIRGVGFVIQKRTS